jgi:hypothetical protein
VGLAFAVAKAAMELGVATKQSICRPIRPDWMHRCSRHAHRGQCFEVAAMSPVASCSPAEDERVRAAQAALEETTETPIPIVA